MGHSVKHAPSIVDGKLTRTSVSAMQKAARCPRAYRYRYVEKLPEPKSPGLETGTRAHARMADYLATWDVEKLSPMERVGLARGLVPSKEELKAFNLALPAEANAAGVPLTGEIDALALLKGSAPGVLSVIDWKFKKSLERYASTPESLASPEAEEGIQMLGYAAALLSSSAWAPASFELRHVTFSTQGAPDVKPSAISVTPFEARQRWASISDRLVPVMRQAAAAECPEDVPQNLNACDAYGGCPYRYPKGPCPGKGRPSVASLFGSTRSEKVSSKMSGLLDGLEDIDETPAQAAPSAPFEGVLPPDAPASNPLLASKQDDTPKEAEPESSVPQTESQMVEALEASINQVKRGRGRPKKNPLPEPVTVQVPPPIQTAQTPPAARVVSPPPQAAPPQAGGFSLYFGCAPLRQPAQTLGKYVEALDEALRKAAQLNCPDIRTTTSQDFSFGKWRGYLAKLALETPPAPGHYVVTRGDERVEVVAEALMDIADLVVMGSR